jgi:hypothetical protein
VDNFAVQPEKAGGILLIGVFEQILVDDSESRILVQMSQVEFFVMKRSHFVKCLLFEMKEVKGLFNLAGIETLD